MNRLLMLSQYPLVSICTPTFNRRPFIPHLIQSFQKQTYPKEFMEWIIYDDGTDPVGDLFLSVLEAKYIYNPCRQTLGKKRNEMHKACKGSIIVYMDDDDYYPPERVSHAVEQLIANPEFLLAGASEMHIYFKSKECLYQFGPYGKYHSTAATFAFRKELLEISTYDCDDVFSEEKKFTKNYTVPLLQLEPKKTILVVAHRHNSLNRELLLETPEQAKITKSPYSVEDFMVDPDLRQFYIYDVDEQLRLYEPGKPEHKPEIMEQMKLVQERRRQCLLQQTNNNSNNKELQDIINAYEAKLDEKNLLINKLLQRVKELSQKT